ncbi:flavodoxin family protein [Clostridium sp. JS66]|uniref:flavodoxin family protein n=1 Tax=Clostridium sp. JS66 TaxID=3064705 RepID=UPI00298E4098|nr:flavodoxin family protein [Clostridium sp. JS66]WPC39734.1 flavodoxin family protein [Clostridium sp. JS66]
MKVLLLNGSSRTNGCTYTALAEITKVLKEQQIECEIVNIGNQPIRDCIGCNKCGDLHNACVFNDDSINELLKKAENADGFIFGTPVYYAHPSGRLLSVLDRLFYAGSNVFRHKPAAAIASARRAGTTASIDVLNKYFTIAEMPVVSSTYWNMVHGSTPEDVKKDLEGLQTMRNIGKNMAWLLKCIELGKKHGINIPETQKSDWTNFIR